MTPHSERLPTQATSSMIFSRLLFALLVAAPLLTGTLRASEFAAPGGPLPGKLTEALETLRQARYDLELLISFGTSKGGSAGHLALAIHDAASGEEPVYSANFYADRDAKHDQRFYTEALMLRIPKQEYLFGTHSSLGDKASFGLDFGEVYKRSVIGIRVGGVSPEEKTALAAYFERINADYRRRARDTEYHAGEIKYDYLQLNCAKTIGAAFRYGTGYQTLEVSSAPILKRRRVAIATQANIPTEMALRLMQEWQSRGYSIDVVLYRKYPESNWIDPHEEEKIRFRDLPNRFPSVLSRDFRQEQGEYIDYDNLYAMYLLYNLGRYSVSINPDTQALEVVSPQAPMDYAEAAEQAAQHAKADSAGFLRRLPFRKQGSRIGDPGALAPLPRSPAQP